MDKSILKLELSVKGSSYNQIVKRLLIVANSILDKTYTGENANSIYKIKRYKSKLTMN